MTNEKAYGLCTLEYYNMNASTFAAGTVSVDFKETQNRFLGKLNKGDYILDFGCGSGRDTKCFREHGMQVDAIDGSEELCKIASEYTGIPVRNMLFQDLKAKEEYHGIWACSSILHLDKTELKSVLIKMVDALKPGGIIYTSFKYGNFEGIRNERYFTDFTKESFDEFLSDMNTVLIEERWITGDVRPGRGEEKWLNIFLRKN